MDMLTPKPAKEVLWWSIFLGICFGPYWVYILIVGKKYENLELVLAIRKLSVEKINELLSIVGLFDLLGFVSCIFICLLWYRFSKTKIRRKKLPYFFGSIIFALVTFFTPLLGSLMEKRIGDMLTLPISNEQFASKAIFFSAYLVVALVVGLVLSYILHFRTCKALE